MSSDSRAALAIIGGSGFYDFFGDDATTVDIDTPYGCPSAPITVGEVEGRQVAFLPRHGRKHEYSAHTVPYRANMWALRSVGVRRIFAPCAVGSLRADWGPGTVAVPDQLVDRTSGREQSYFDTGGVHVSFADPYCDELRTAATHSAVDELAMKASGTMVVVQGPRFSTRAESRWFAAQGWELVNMTGYPESVLARELEMCYAAIALVTDLDAGLETGTGVSTAAVFAEFERNLVPFKGLVRQAVSRVEGVDTCDRCRVHDGVRLPFELP